MKDLSRTELSDIVGNLRVIEAFSASIIRWAKDPNLHPEDHAARILRHAQEALRKFDCQVSDRKFVEPGRPERDFKQFRIHGEKAEPWNPDKDLPSEGDGIYHAIDFRGFSEIVSVLRDIAASPQCSEFHSVWAKNYLGLDSEEDAGK